MWFVSGCWLYDLVNTLTLKNNKNIKYLKNCKRINYKELQKKLFNNNN